MNLYAIEDGDRIEGNSDDRDLYVRAADVPAAISFWRTYYGAYDDEKPFRVWQITSVGQAGALDWDNPDDMEDVTP